MGGQRGCYGAERQICKACSGVTPAARCAWRSPAFERWGRPWGRTPSSEWRSAAHEGEAGMVVLVGWDGGLRRCVRLSSCMPSRVYHAPTQPVSQQRALVHPPAAHRCKSQTARQGTAGKGALGTWSVCKGVPYCIIGPHSCLQSANQAFPLAPAMMPPTHGSAALSHRASDRLPCREVKSEERGYDGSGAGGGSGSQKCLTASVLARSALMQPQRTQGVVSPVTLLAPPGAAWR